MTMSSELNVDKFLIFMIIIFVVLFVLAWISYDPDQRKFTLYDIAQNGTFNFPRFSGQILIRDHMNGGVTEWLVGGDAVEIVSCSAGCSDIENPESGLLTYNSTIKGYTWTQSKWSVPSTYTFITNRLGKSAH